RARGARAGTASGQKPRPLAAVTAGAALRRTTGLAELDRVLGGGLVAGSVVLVGGDPGIGKSTLALQACGALARQGLPVLYVAGAKASGVACFLIGHVTKEGTLAGPRVLEHLVDTVLYFEGDGAHALRVLRAVKNRFGSTNEVAVFEMGEGGLAEVPNPSAAFLAERPVGAPGSAVLATLEGSRPLLVEIQALVSHSGLALPRRTAIGLDPGRVALLLA